MDRLWYYWTHREGKVHGPCHAHELRRMADSGLLESNDVIWPVGTDPREAIGAESALCFNRAATVEAGVPNWLADVSQAEERAGPLPRDCPLGAAPDWLDDLRSIEGQPSRCEKPVSAQPAAKNCVDWANAIEIPLDLVPDWLAHVPPSSEPPRSSGADSRPATPGHAPLPRADGERPPGVVAPAPVALPPVAPTLNPSPASTSVPLAAPVVPTIPNWPPSAAPAAAPIETARLAPAVKVDVAPPVQRPEEETRAPAPSPAAPVPAAAAPLGVRGESLQEVYQRAQSVLQQWCDLEVNRPLISAGDVDAVRRDPVIKALVELLSKYGQGVVQRFCQHLEFVLQNRKRYFEAMTGGS